MQSLHLASPPFQTLAAMAGPSAAKPGGVIYHEYREGVFVAIVVAFPLYKNRVVSVKPHEQWIALELLSHCRRHPDTPLKDLKLMCNDLRAKLRKEKAPIGGPLKPPTSPHVSASSASASSGGELLGAVKGPMAIAGPESNPEGKSLGSDGQEAAEERHGSRIVDT